MLTTRQKIAAARLLEGPLVALRRWMGLDSRVRVQRGGVTWQLDLDEGIDFSIYLLGAFERRLARAFRRWVRPGSNVLDIGANVGAHTLPLARLVGTEGRVWAIEPTEWAFSKLSANVALNPELAARIALHQMFLTARDDADLPARVFSSWPLAESPDLHPRLRGRAMPTGAASALSLDTAIERIGARSVDFVKIDVDGHEGEVLRGARGMLERHAPVVLFELAPYLLVERGERPDAVLDPLRAAGYSLSDLARGEPLSPAAVDRLGVGQAINIVAEPPRAPSAAREAPRALV